MLKLKDDIVKLKATIGEFRLKSFLPFGSKSDQPPQFHWPPTTVLFITDIWAVKWEMGSSVFLDEMSYTPHHVHSYPTFVLLRTILVIFCHWRVTHTFPSLGVVSCHVMLIFWSRVFIFKCCHGAKHFSHLILITHLQLLLAKNLMSFFTYPFQRVEISSLVNIVPFWFQSRINVHSLGTCFLSDHRWSRLQRIYGWSRLGWKRWWRKSPVLTIWSRVRSRRWKRRWRAHLRFRVPRSEPNQLRKAQHPLPQHSLRCVSSANAFHRHHGTHPQLLSSWLDSRVQWISNGGTLYTKKDKLHLHGPRDENTSCTTGDQGINLLYSVATKCGHGLDCPAYQADKPITCAVWTM